LLALKNLERQFPFQRKKKLGGQNEKGKERNEEKKGTKTQDFMSRTPRYSFLGDAVFSLHYYSPLSLSSLPFSTF
jgi:hypothetical protein